MSKVYPGSPPVRALDAVSLSVADGELVAVVGPSGSGKTTMLHLMGTLDQATSGVVRVTGLEVARLRDRELSALRARRIGFVFLAGLLPAIRAARLSPTQALWTL